MNDSRNIPPIQEQDISLKGILIKGKEYVIALWKGKVLILALAVICSGIFYYRAYIKPVTYSATLTFALNEGDGSGYSGIGGLLGQFGLGGNSSGKVSLDKIVALSRTMNIVSQALFEKSTVNGSEDFLANHIVALHKMDKKWAKSNPAFIDFRFQSDSFPLFTLNEKAALKGVYGFTVGGIKPGLVNCNYNTESSIFSLTTTSINEELSLALTQYIFNHLSQFYIQQSSDKQKQTYDLVKAKADSLYKKWTSSEYTISNMDESEGALWAPTDRTRKTIQTKQSNLYALAYGEAIKNLEMADYALKNSTPFIREIDKPFSPLDGSSPNRRRQIIIGLMLGAFLGSVWVLGKKIIVEAINS